MKLEAKKEVRKVPVLRFPEFQGGWEQSKLENVTKYTKGFAFKSDNYTESGVRIIRVSDLGKDQIKNHSDKVYISHESSKIYTRYKINKDNIIITTVGSKPDMIESAVGRGIFVSEDGVGLLNQNMLKFDNIAKASNGFIIGYINSNRYRLYIKAIARGNANQANITVKDLLKFEISIPSLAEQQKIASFLTAVDKKIQQLTRKKELLEQYIKGVMQKIFSQEIRFKDENGNDYPDWEEKELSEFLNPTFREIPTPSKLYLAIGVRSHCRGTFHKPDSDPNKIAMEKLFVVKENDLVVNITFAWEGAIAIVKKIDEGGLVSHRFPTYTFNREKVLNEFFKYIIVQKRFRHTLDLISPGGAGRNRVLSKKALLKIEWTMPLIEEQKRIATFLECLDKRINQATQQLIQAKEFKKGLLQQMFI